MKIGSLLILILLIDLPAGPATLRSEEQLLNDPLGASYGAATSLNISFDPPAVLLGDPVTVTIDAPELANNTTVLMAFYRQSESDELLQETQWQLRVVNGSASSKPVLLQDPGRYHLAAVIDVFGIGNFLPYTLPAGLLESMAAKRISDVRELFVHPLTYASLTQ